jgi:hypothetical protein
MPSAIRKVVGYPNDAVDHPGGAKVEQQAQALVGKADIGERLLLMDGREFFNGLQFKTTSPSTRRSALKPASNTKFS